MVTIMAVLSIGEVPELNRILASYGFKIHLHDACGGQSFSLEGEKEPEEAMFTELEAFFNNHRMSVHYYGGDKLNFIAK